MNRTYGLFCTLFDVFLLNSKWKSARNSALHITFSTFNRQRMQTVVNAVERHHPTMCEVTISPFDSRVSYCRSVFLNRTEIYANTMAMQTRCISLSVNLHVDPRPPIEIPYGMEWSLDIPYGLIGDIAPLPPWEDDPEPYRSPISVYHPPPYVSQTNPAIQDTDLKDPSSCPTWIAVSTFDQDTY